MGFYRDRVYPQLVARLGDPPPIRSRRRQLLSEARGDVLEIGVGPGVNVVHYDPREGREALCARAQPWNGPPG